MIEEHGAIDEKIIPMTDTQSLHVSIKSSNGKLFLDLRKWFKYQNMDYPIASKKGIMLDFDNWHHIIPIVNDYISKYENVDKLSILDY